MASWRCLTLSIFLTLLPLVFAIGTVALILAEFTPLFTWLSYPMGQAGTAYSRSAGGRSCHTRRHCRCSYTVLATNIESELTRFVIACSSQLSYVEIGALLLKSKIPIKFWSWPWYSCCAGDYAADHRLYGPHVFLLGPGMNESTTMTCADLLIHLLRDTRGVRALLGIPGVHTVGLYRGLKAVG